MAFFYDSAGYPTIMLQPKTTYKLLRSIRDGMVDMAYFPELYHPRQDQQLSSDELSQEDLHQVNQLLRKIKFDASGQVQLGRELKIRLLKAIRANQINLLSDFPELAKAYQAVQQDWSALSPDEKEFLLDYCRKLN
ncbi:hypothetical protein GCM10028808_60690 [Spirosoma migulaei]